MRSTTSPGLHARAATAPRAAKTARALRTPHLLGAGPTQQALDLTLPRQLRRDEDAELVVREARDRGVRPALHERQVRHLRPVGAGAAGSGRGPAAWGRRRGGAACVGRVPSLPPSPPSPPSRAIRTMSCTASAGSPPCATSAASSRTPDRSRPCPVRCP